MSRHTSHVSSPPLLPFVDLLLFAGSAPGLLCLAAHGVLPPKLSVSQGLFVAWYWPDALRRSSLLPSPSLLALLHVVVLPPWPSSCTLRRPRYGWRAVYLRSVRASVVFSTRLLFARCPGSPPPE